MIKRALATLTVMLIASNANAVPRTETLECTLPDGSMFVLSARHDWEPMSAISPHVSERYEQGRFHIAFQRKQSRKRITIARLTPDYQPFDDATAADQLCGDMGVVGGVPYAGLTRFLPIKARSFVQVTTRPPVQIAGPRDEQPAELAARLSGLAAFPSFSALSAAGPIFIAETALINSSLDVVAVYQSTSHDRSVTWSAPRVTEQAKIFKIGMPLSAQPAIARASRINGSPVAGGAQ